MELLQLKGRKKRTSITNNNMSDEQQLRKLYVGGIPYASTEAEIETAFAECGTVKNVQIIIDRMTGRSKGFGFVEMSTEDEALEAIEKWHDKTFGGRKLTVNLARPLPKKTY